MRSEREGGEEKSGDGDADDDEDESLIRKHDSNRVYGFSEKV